MTPRWARSLQHVLVLALTLDVVGQLVGLVGDGSKDFLAVTALAALVLAGSRACPIGVLCLRVSRNGNARTGAELKSGASTPAAGGRR